MDDPRSHPSRRAAKAMGCSCTWWGEGSIVDFDPHCAIIDLHKGFSRMSGPAGSPSWICKQDKGCDSLVACVNAERCLWNIEQGLTNRPDRDHWFLQMAALAAMRSTCLRGQVGAVVVRDNHVISMGYNGAPPGQPHCLDVGCDELTVMPVNLPPGDFHDEYIELGCQRAIHAEANALAWAARFGVPTLDSTVYATHSPCPTCARLCVSAGVAKYVYSKAYRITEGIDILDRCNVEVIHVP